MYEVTDQHNAKTVSLSVYEYATDTEGGMIKLEQEDASNPGMTHEIFLVLKAEYGDDGAGDLIESLLEMALNTIDGDL